MRMEDLMRYAKAMVMAAAMLGLGAGFAGAAPMRLDGWRGHVGIGFASVVSDANAPGGSLSVAAGVDYAIGSPWRLGPTVSFDILGSSNVERGSIRAGLDYSLFEAALLATWTPAHGPFARVSFGPGVASPRVELSIAGGGAGFSDLTLGEVKGEMALDATLMSRHSPVVAAGVELGTRWIPTSQGSWTLLTGRLVIHY
jgi:hypothetical protein